LPDPDGGVDHEHEEDDKLLHKMLPSGERTHGWRLRRDAMPRRPCTAKLRNHPQYYKLYLINNVLSISLVKNRKIESIYKYFSDHRKRSQLLLTSPRGSFI
jgi:hypothetical protein